MLHWRLQRFPQALRKLFNAALSASRCPAWQTASSSPPSPSPPNDPCRLPAFERPQCALVRLNLLYPSVGPALVLAISSLEITTPSFNIPSARRVGQGTTSRTLRANVMAPRSLSPASIGLLGWCSQPDRSTRRRER